MQGRSQISHDLATTNNEDKANKASLQRMILQTGL